MEKPFKDNNSIILTSSIAKKYFGDEAPIGKILIADKENFTVTGVVEDFRKIQVSVTMCFSQWGLFAKQFAANGGNGDWKTMDEDLGNYQYNIFLQLEKNASPATVGKKITDAYWRHRPGENPANGFLYTALAEITSFNSNGWQHQRFANGTDIFIGGYTHFNHRLY